jgi:hypothetical protein
MTKNLTPRIERLEHLGWPTWQAKLCAFARKLAFDEEEFLGAVKGHERQLAQHVDEDGRVTWEGFQLLYGLLSLARAPRLTGAGRSRDSTWRTAAMSRPIGRLSVPRNIRSLKLDLSNYPTSAVREETNTMKGSKQNMTKPKANATAARGLGSGKKVRRDAPQRIAFTTREPAKGSSAVSHLQ